MLQILVEKKSMIFVDCNYSRLLFDLMILTPVDGKCAGISTFIKIFSKKYEISTLKNQGINCDFEKIYKVLTPVNGK